MSSDSLIRSSGFHALSGKHCVLGIDEAGRGPVLGPMVYGAAIALSSKYQDDKVTDESLAAAADSKTLTEETREQLFTQMDSGEVQRWMVYVLDVISPQYISTCMLGRMKISLNEVSHNAAAGLIRAALSACIILDHVYVDTVGPPESYEKKLRALFKGVEITVSKKADSLF